jgi:hypothetical protein
MATRQAPFLKSSEAYQKMVELFENGQIDPSEPPRVAYTKHPLFRQYSLQSFRAQLNKYKVQNNMMIRKDDAQEGKYNMT